MNFVYISDFLYPEVNGGAEQNDAELCNILLTRGHEVVKVKSDEITDEFLWKHMDHKFIISNFVFLFNRMRDLIIQNCDYILYTHDHQYLITRNPAPYRDTDFVAPKSDLKHVEFYENAKAIICQSSLHAEIVYKNLELDNIYSIGGNLWTESTLNLLEELSESEKENKASIMQSPIGHKNTEGAVEFCKKMKIDYELIMPQAHEDFLKAISKNKEFIFFPQTVETLSRIVCEARMMNCLVKTNSNIGAASEDWFKYKGKELIEIMREKRESIPNLVEQVFEKTLQF